MPYQIAFERTAERELLALQRPARERILNALRKLAPDPFTAANVKALKGGGYRLRVGDYRVLFTVETEILLVLVIRVGHRREVYRD
jgi:mRNA interferase RelE/StbE